MTFVQTISSTTATDKYTFEDVSFGPVYPDRKIVIPFQTRKTAGGLCAIKSCTINGVPASVVVEQATSSSGTANHAGMVIASVPSGTIGTVFLEYTVSVLRVGGQVYSITESPYDWDSSLLDMPSVQIDIPANGLAIGCLAVASAQAINWVGLNQDASDIVGGSLRCASASKTFTSAITGETLGIVRTSGSWSTPVAIFASFQKSDGPPETNRKRRRTLAAQKYFTGMRTR